MSRCSRSIEVSNEVHRCFFRAWTPSTCFGGITKHSNAMQWGCQGYAGSTYLLTCECEVPPRFRADPMNYPIFWAMQPCMSGLVDEWFFYHMEWVCSSTTDLSFRGLSWMVELFVHGRRLATVMLISCWWAFNSRLIGVKTLPELLVTQSAV